jgi:hypothetical protein
MMGMHCSIYVERVPPQWDNAGDMMQALLTQ